MPAIELENVSKRYSGAGTAEVLALRDFNLSVRDGELLVLTGPSGCGKTTALRLLAGLEKPDSGSIKFGGLQAQPSKLVPGLAMVFQQPALYPHMTARENIAFGLKVRGATRPEMEVAVQAAAQMAGVGELLDRLPQQLSGGEAQRVSLARAVALKPQVLLLDEPLSSVDAPGKAALREDISRMQRTLGMTMIYVTHDQQEAMAVADRLAVMHRGAVLQVGSPSEVYDAPANPCVALFFGSPPINILRSGPANCLVENGEIGLRPEHVELEGTPPADVFIWEAKVLWVRFAGSECHVACDVIGQQVIARAKRPCGLAPGDVVRLWARKEHAVVFK